MTERSLGVVGFEGGFVLLRGPDTVLVPDVAFVRAERWPEADGEDHFGEVAPDLAVEVRSPSESMGSPLAKARRYIAAGVLLVWLVDPDARTVTVRIPGLEPYTLTDGGILEGGDVIPGFRLPVSDVFR